VTGSASGAVRVYGNLRTAHLERFRAMEPADVLYTGTRRDFDESLIDPAHPPVRLSGRDVLRRLASSPYAVVEVNEPAMVNRWGFLLALVATIRIAGVLHRRRTSIVTYCIANADPADELRERWRIPTAVGRVLARAVMSLLVEATDRVAFGTSGSEDLYRGFVGTTRLAGRARLFEGLPSPCGCGDGEHDEHADDRLLFVGGFVERKGVRQAMQAWDSARTRCPSATFVVVGHGPLEHEVKAWASERPEVTVIVDPPRPEVHAQLRRAGVLILLSQPHRHWREQIGLPILEGLSHGCEIVATTETGLAGWLVDHGHSVVAPDAPPDEVGDQIVAAFGRARERSGSLDDLPSVDQRIAADRWMITGAVD
jgi:glycosyltransferase involved in cell wall biosynthesis